MLNFFKGWKRKAGVGTLVIACVFMAWWVRSEAIFDSIALNGWSNIRLQISSTSGLFCLKSERNTVEGRELIEWDTFPATEEDYWSLVKTKSLWARCGFSYFQGETVIPYWFIVLPLTLLSAWMLLSKPRPAKST